MRSLSEVDLLEREVRCSHTSAIEVKNVWNFISAAPQHFQMSAMSLDIQISTAFIFDFFCYGEL